MNFKKTFIISVLLGLMAVNFSSPENVSASGEVPPKDEYLFESQLSETSSVVRISKEKLSITPYYIPIPYTYIYTKYYTNTQLGTLKSQLENAGVYYNAAQLALTLVSFPTSVGRPIGALGYLISSSVQNQIDHFQSTYDRGLGMQLIVRKNPNYNGYNSATFAEWVPTSSPMW